MERATRGNNGFLFKMPKRSVVLHMLRVIWLENYHRALVLRFYAWVGSRMTEKHL